MKVTVEVKTKEYVEVELPLFFNHAGLPMAVLNEKESVYITSDSIVQTATTVLLAYYKDSEPITAEEFTRVFDSRMEQLQSFKSQFFNQ